jgi:hypothetical protein
MNFAVKRVALQPRIHEVIGSNLGPETDYLD